MIGIEIPWGRVWFSVEAKPCNLGVGCNEAGVCYASAHGEPQRCGELLMYEFHVTETTYEYGCCSAVELERRFAVFVEEMRGFKTYAFNEGSSLGLEYDLIFGTRDGKENVVWNRHTGKIVEQCDNFHHAMDRCYTLNNIKRDTFNPFEYDSVE